MIKHKLPIYESGIISKKILKVLYSVHKPLKVNEIRNLTGLRRKQIWRCLTFLKGVGAITKTYEFTDNIPPQRHLIVSLTKSQVRNARRYLRKYGWLK